MFIAQNLLEIIIIILTTLFIELSYLKRYMVLASLMYPYWVAKSQLRHENASINPPGLTSDTISAQGDLNRGDSQ